MISVCTIFLVFLFFILMFLYLVGVFNKRIIPLVLHASMAFCLCHLISKPRDYQGERVNPHIGPLTKVIRLKLFLDTVPSSFADITHALRGCFRGGSVYVSFRFVSF